MPRRAVSSLRACEARRVAFVLLGDVFLYTVPAAAYAYTRTPSLRLYDGLIEFHIVERGVKAVFIGNWVKKNARVA